MKYSIYILLILAGSANLLTAQETAVQTSPATETAANIGKSIGLYVFPSKEQDQATQDADELACYKWAMEQTGYDPINPPQIQAEQVDRSPDGTAIAGAARGAAAGAAIGAIAGDAGEGAAIGAVAGAMRGRRAKVVGDQMEQQQNNAAAEAKQKELTDGFRKAFSACMEGKGYTVK
jgi:hypothetical protein